MSTSVCRPPACAKSDCWMTVDSLRSRIASTCSMTSGDVRSIVAMRSATSRCCSSGSEPITIAAGVGVHVREHERDRLRVLVLEVREHLAGVGAAEELERRRDHRDAEVVEDLVGLVAAEARLEQLARGLVSALGDVGARGERVAELAHHLFDLVELEVVQPRDLGHDLGDFLLAQRAQDRRRAVLPDLHHEDRGLLHAAEATRHGYVLRSASQERRVCATSSGWCSMRSVSSPSTPDVGGRCERSSLGAGESGHRADRLQCARVGGFELAQVERHSQRNPVRLGPLDRPPGEEQHQRDDQQRHDVADEVDHRARAAIPTRPSAAAWPPSARVGAERDRRDLHDVAARLRCSRPRLGSAWSSWRRRPAFFSRGVRHMRGNGE